MTALIMLGLIFIGGAVVGGGLRAGGVQIPIVTTKFGCIGLFLTGMFAIGLGVWVNPSLAETKISPPSIVVPGGPSVTTPQAAQPIDPVDFQAPVMFSHDKVDGELDLDFNPPMRVNGHDINQPIFDEPILGADPDVSLAEWDRQDPPTKQQCVDRLARHGVAQTGRLVAGNVVCVRTAQGRIARLIIRSTNNSQIRGDATIWKK